MAADGALDRPGRGSALQREWRSHAVSPSVSPGSFVAAGRPRVLSGAPLVAGTADLDDRSPKPAVIHLMESYGMEISGSMLKAPLAVHIHMNFHMASPYRIWEAIRKSGQISSSPNRMVGGV